MIVDHFNPQGVDISNHDNDNRLHGGQYEPIKIPVHPKTEMTGHEQMEAIEILKDLLTETLQCSAQEAERILKEIV